MSRVWILTSEHLILWTCFVCVTLVFTYIPSWQPWGQRVTSRSSSCKSRSVASWRILMDNYSHFCALPSQLAAWEQVHQQTHQELQAANTREERAQEQVQQLQQQVSQITEHWQSQLPIRNVFMMLSIFWALPTLNSEHLLGLHTSLPVVQQCL